MALGDIQFPLLRRMRMTHSAIGGTTRASTGGLKAAINHTLRGRSALNNRPLAAQPRSTKVSRSRSPAPRPISAPRL